MNDGTQKPRRSGRGAVTTHTTEVSLSEWDRNAADWQAKGWQLVKITTFRGACDPLAGGARPGMETFTLGCFQWRRRGANGQGQGLKKGRVQYRIKGHVSDPHDAHRRAREFCDRKNAEMQKEP